MEKWKFIEESDKYLVSTHGRVVSAKHGTKFLGGGVKPSGYRYVLLYLNDKPCTRTIHRLVAEAFIKNAKRLPEVNHKDCNKLNNHYSNLEWTTRKGNMEHAGNNGLMPRGEKNTNARLNEAIVIEIRRLHKEGEYINHLAKRFSVSHPTVFKVVHRKTWKHIL